MWKSSMINYTDSMPLNYICDKRDFRNAFGIGESEELLYCRDTSFWNSRDQGCVITDWGIRVIPDNENPSEKVELAWAFVEEVTYKDEVLYFWCSKDHDLDYCTQIHRSFFSKQELSYALIGLAEHFSEIAKLAIVEQHPIDIAIAQMNEANDPEVADSIGREMLGKFPDLDYIVHYQLGLNAYPNDLEKAYNHFSKSLVYEENESSSIRTWAHYFLGSILDIKEEYDNPDLRSHYFMAAKGDPECEFSDSNKSVVEESLDELNRVEHKLAENGYGEIAYDQRKVIFPVKNLISLSDITQEQVRPVLLSALKESSGLNFPIAHPVANTLYVCHPYVQTKYILFEDYEIELLEDKLREFSIIAQALGATEICVKVESSLTEEERKQQKVDINGKGETWYADGAASYSGKNSSNITSKWEHMFNRKQILKPNGAPYVPEGLVWLSGEPDWQRLIKQRLNGSLQYHHESWSTKKSRIVSGLAENMLRMELQTLYADLGMDWSETEEYFSSSENNLSLSIDVTFDSQATVSQLSQTTVLSQNEQEYLDEFRECSADGQVSTSERRLLNRLGARLGLTESRIAELEQSLIPKLSPDEEEYLTEYKQCLKDDPSMSASTRRLLKRLASSLSLTNEQVTRLEQL